jgi:hypothetical protein
MTVLLPDPSLYLVCLMYSTSAMMGLTQVVPVVPLSMVVDTSFAAILLPVRQNH